MKYEIEYEVHYVVRKTVDANSMEEAERLSTEEKGQLIKITVPVVCEA